MAVAVPSVPLVPSVPSVPRVEQVEQVEQAEQAEQAEQMEQQLAAQSHKLSYAWGLAGRNFAALFVTHIQQTPIY
jgi:hypothetical protein